ncbi:hypothetical protein BB561_006374 [Smittium simulii]|uniref:Uncharacterized protein n=1 Tax=Smittium simulii TaxID=133385 RepID=A0A2T9Y4W3_9FUNG|nr:hypothetical protein BB561_006374 [Smittium simulii]
MVDQLVQEILDGLIEQFPKLASIFSTEVQVQTRLQYLCLAHIVELITDVYIDSESGPGTEHVKSSAVQSTFPLSHSGQVEPKPCANQIEDFEIRKLFSGIKDSAAFKLVSVEPEQIVTIPDLKSKVYKRVQDDYMTIEQVCGENTDNLDITKDKTDRMQILVAKQIEYFKLLQGELESITRLLLCVGKSQDNTGGHDIDFQSLDKTVATSLIEFYARLAASMELKLKLLQMDYLRRRFSLSTLKALHNVDRSLQLEMECLSIKNQEIKTRLQVYSLGGSDFMLLANEYLRITNLISDLYNDINTFKSDL